MARVTPLPALTAPFFLAHRALRGEIAALAASTSGTVIDVGCGSAPYRALFAHATYIGVEVPAASQHGSAKSGADVLYDGRALPFADASANFVLCNQVLEHVFEPAPFLRELHRILRPNGRVLMTVPFVWDEHEQPYDFARYSSFGLAYLARKAGFEVVESRRTLADASLFAQLWLAYWFKVIRRSNPASRMRKLMLAAICVPTNLLGLLLGKLLPTNPDLYLDNVIILARPTISGGTDGRQRLE